MSSGVYVPTQSTDETDQHHRAILLSDDVQYKSHSSNKTMHIRKRYIRCFLAEFIGTFVLVAMGDAAVAQTVLSKGQDGNIVTVQLGFGLAVMCGVLVSMGTSGGHVNPAFTLVAGLLRKLPWPLVPVYMAGQYLGGFAAAVAVFVVYRDSLDTYEMSCNVTRAVNGPCATAGIWATYPQLHVSDIQGFADQVMGTLLLVLLVLALTDKKNMQVPDFAIPPMIGAIVCAVLTGYVFNCGGALNPARDLAPRIFTAVAGWGMDVFKHPSPTWFLVPIFGPYIGAMCGALMYQICIGLHQPAPAEAPQLKKVRIVEDGDLKAVGA